jgi:hypothetical protein
MTTSKRAAPWSPEENAALVALYFTMLDKATAGQSYNKAAMIRIARMGVNVTDPVQSDHNGYAFKLTDRSRGSIEAKLMNASAAHRDILHATGQLAEHKTMAGYGYKAWGNYQKDLKDAMRAEISRRLVTEIEYGLSS